LKTRTEKLYYDYSSASPFGAEILELRPSVDGNNTILLLDKTIFYPEGGGQSADRGTINGVRLLDVQEKDGEILHLVSGEDAARLKPGPAELILDIRRRRDFTQLHTGQHLLSATILRMTGAPTVSMHLGDETSTIDVESAEISNEVLLAIEETVADAIEENHPVIIHLCPPEDVSSFPLRKIPPKGEEVLRIVEIEGCDCIACCGTHVRSTAEIGLFRILGAEKYKGMTRISFTAGRRLLRDSRLLRQNAMIVSRALSAPLSETGKKFLEFLGKTALTEKRLKALEDKAVREKAENLLRKAADAAGGSGPVIVVEAYKDEDMNEVHNIGKLAQKQCQAILILASEKELKFTAFCSAQGFDLRSFLKDAFEAHGGKGGGSSSFFQGSFGTKEALHGFLEAYKTKRFS
jgi:alanyl-tRNA synthetase